ncbi:hypothetical protein BJX76DRAFT_360103 [Aspergillus varians]
MRKEHPEHMENLQIGGHGNIKPPEIAAGEKALKQFAASIMNSQRLRAPGSTARVCNIVLVALPAITLEALWLL